MVLEWHTYSTLRMNFRQILSQRWRLDELLISYFICNFSLDFTLIYESSAGVLTGQFCVSCSSILPNLIVSLFNGTKHKSDKNTELPILRYFCGTEHRTWCWNTERFAVKYRTPGNPDYNVSFHKRNVSYCLFKWHSTLLSEYAKYLETHFNRRLIWKAPLSKKGYNQLGVKYRLVYWPFYMKV